MSFRNSDRPENFALNTTHLCGITRPQAQAFTALSVCCKTPVEVWNACFQYCGTSLAQIEFAECVGGIIERPFMTTCNRFDNIDAGTGVVEEAPGRLDLSLLLPDAGTLQRIFCGPAVWMILAVLIGCCAWTVVKRLRIISLRQRERLRPYAKTTLPSDMDFGPPEPP